MPPHIGLVLGWGFFRSTLLTQALSAGLSAFLGTLAAMPVMMAVAAPRFIATPRADATSLIVVPKGNIVALAALAGITFLVEGAMLGLGALFLTGRGLMTPAKAGLGYNVFAIAMTARRFAGDTVVARRDGRRTMLGRGLLAVVGMVVLLLAPVLFRQAGAQTATPAGLAVASLAVIGYTGVLAGPAVIGFVAQHTGLPAAFWLLTLLLCALPASARVLRWSR